MQGTGLIIVKKNHLNLAAYDLNLLTAFDALMKEGHVSRAADRVGRTQSAMSHTLRRLQDLFGDKLFVRVHNRFEPTPKALELAGIIAPALASMRMALAGQIYFDPKTSQRQFVVGMPEIASFVLMPQIMPALARVAPNVDLNILDVASSNSSASIMSGQIELAIGYFPELPGQIQGRQLAALDSVVIADESNRFLREGRMDLESFLAAPHVSTTVSNDPFGTDIDRHLQSIGAQRRIALQLPHQLAIPGAIKGTNLVATVERRILSRLRDADDLVRFELPFQRPAGGVLLIWHERHELDPGHRWFREFVIGAVAN
jgi:DNA-binding transcriptional LysR family regulator